MISELFGSKKKKEDFRASLVHFFLHKEVVSQLDKAQSLKKLGRNDESRQLLLKTEQMVTNYLKKNPQEKNAHMTMVLFYVDTGQADRAENIIDRLLKSTEFQLTEDERIGLGHELLKIQRQRPPSDRPADTPRGFTTVYGCQNCGRIYNFVSMPCPHCDWSPKTINEMAHSIVLSSRNLDIPRLLFLARAMATGRRADDVVPNLTSEAQRLLTNAGWKQVIDRFFSQLRQYEHKHRSIRLISECDKCGCKLMFSGTAKCEQCNNPVNWPDALRTLMCMNNLLWLFEQRVEIRPSEALSEFVCVLVSMMDNLLRKQEFPLDQHRRYAIDLLSSMQVIIDLNKGAFVDTTNPNDLRLNLIKNQMREDSESYGKFLLMELEFFVKKMVHGDRI